MTQVTLLNSFSNITGTLLFPTISAGADRKAILIIGNYHGSANVSTPSAVTIGGQTPTFEGGLALSTSNARLSASVFSLNEAKIAAMVGSAVVLTGGGYNERLVLAGSIQNTSQTVNTSNGVFNAGGGAVTSGAVSSLARQTESWTLHAAVASTLTTATMSNPSNVAFFSGSNFRATVGYANDTARTVDASFTISSNRIYTTAINFAPVPTATIDTINGSSFGAVNAGSTGNTVTTTASFVPTSGTHGGKAISAIVGSAGSYTFTSAAYVDGAPFPEPDTAQTFALTDGTSTPTASSVFASTDGMASVVIASPITADSTYIGSVYTLADDDRWVYPTMGGDFFVDADGKINALNAGTYVCWHWRASDGVMTQVTLNISEAGAIVTVTSRNHYIGLGLGIGF